MNIGNVFEKSTLNIDVGFNLKLKLQGDLVAMSANLIIRNAINWGNCQFIEKVYNVQSKLFFYNTFQIRIKAQNNVFINNAPIGLKISLNQLMQLGKKGVLFGLIIFILQLILIFGLMKIL